MFKLKNLFTNNFLRISFKNLSRFFKSDTKNITNTQNEPELMTSDKPKLKSSKIKSQTINIENTEAIKIQPYFPKAVSEKEKSYTNVSVSDIVENRKGGIRAQRIQQRQKEKKKNIILENIKRELPNEFYRMGLSGEDMKQHSDLVKRALNLNNASIGEFKKARMLEIRKIFARHERDTANPAITACSLCEQVLNLLTHINRNKTDMSAFIKLQSFLTKRRKYLLYLKRKDFNSYSYVIKYYGLKDFDDSMHKLHFRDRRYPQKWDAHRRLNI